MRRCLTSIVVVLTLLAAPAYASPACSLPSVAELLNMDSPGEPLVQDDHLVRNFVLFSYRNVADDLINRQGAYLDTLKVVFAPACLDEPSLLRWLTALLHGSDSAVEFARRVAAASLQVRLDHPQPEEVP